ncbi:MAG TPA: TolC family protein [Allosphingosinicella sp.]|jgi:adhesin transport system outer membrane protein
MADFGRAFALALLIGVGGAALAQSNTQPGSTPPAGAPPTSFQTTSPQATAGPTFQSPSVSPQRPVTPQLPAPTTSEPPRSILTTSPANAPLATRQTPALPSPSGDPLNIDIASDPILQLARDQASEAEFREVVSTAVERHPGTLEYEAQAAEARAVRAEALEQRLPSIDMNISSYRVIARDFSNDQGNIIERSRPSNRTDAQLSIQQSIFDFGASQGRVAAAGARLRAAAAEAEAGADRIALGAVGAWYDVFAARALVAVTEGFVANQQELREAVAERIRQGASAPGDTARVESYLASAQTRLARFRRLLSTAEARFTELIGSPPPAELDRAPTPQLPVMTRDAVALTAMSSPLARSSQALADAARQEARSSRADRFPQVGVGVDAGRYGVFENDTDYDIRGRVTVRQRLFGGTEARVKQAEARVQQADARATRIREEAARDATIAWSDVRALEEQLKALEASYIASRRSRDVLLERFINARGDLFDVVAAEDAYFETATAYIQALSELDAARYVLLSRTGQLLGVLAIDRAAVGGQRD